MFSTTCPDKYDMSQLAETEVSMMCHDQLVLFGVQRKGEEYSPKDYK